MAPKLNKWTVMIYMAGDNELSNRCVDDLREINRITKRNGVEVIVQVDRSGEDDTMIYHFPQQQVDSEGFEELKSVKAPESTSGKYALSRFINYCLSQSRAERYMLVLWGHARGEAPLGPTAPARRRCPRRGRFQSWTRRGRNGKPDTRKPFYVICPDKRSGQAITNFELRDILRATSRRIGRRIDILGMDACLMGMAEMCYELRESVRYLIGSETLVPGTSWPYHTILQHLVERPEMETGDLCRIIVKAFVAYYGPYDAQDVQLSAFDLARADRLAEASRALSRSLAPHMEPGENHIKSAVLKAHWAAQSYDEDQYIDLFDFCNLLQRHCDFAEASHIQDAARRVMNVLDPRSAAAELGGEPAGDGGFVVASDWYGEEVDHSYGLSIYFPWTEVAEDRYRHLDFAMEEHGDWLNLISRYVSSTEREVRERDDNQNKPEPQVWEGTLVEQRLRPANPAGGE